MTHKGYSAQIEYDDDDSCFIGHIAGIKDIVGFHGESVSELRNAFEEAVEDYLETCEKLNRNPQKPFSGKISLRVSPKIHAEVAKIAKINGKSINGWITEKLEKEIAI